MPAICASKETNKKPPEGGLQGEIAFRLVPLSFDPEPVTHITAPDPMTWNPVMRRARCCRPGFDNDLRHGRSCTRHPVTLVPNPLVALPAPVPIHPVPSRGRRCASLFNNDLGHHTLLSVNHHWPRVSFGSHHAPSQAEHRQQSQRDQSNRGDPFQLHSPTSLAVEQCYLFCTRFDVSAATEASCRYINSRTDRQNEKPKRAPLLAHDKRAS